MRYILIILVLSITLGVFAQVNGSIQFMGNKSVLQVWGDHYQRGYAQGYLLGPKILDIFDQYYYPMVTLSDPVYFSYMQDYYLQHFDIDSRMFSEAEGMLAGMQEAEVSLYHEGLQRDLTPEDILLSNAVVDMLMVRQAFTPDILDIGCASLSSWGVSTQQDSLLDGSAVITRFLDWSQNSALIANPILVIHHPAEQDEQKWMSFTFPGFIGALSAISEQKTAAFLNVGSLHSASNLQGLDPVVFDLRRGIERLDYNNTGFSDALDVVATLTEGNHLSGTIINTLTDDDLQTLPVVVETYNGGTATRYYNQNGGLPGNHLAATNHFRQLTSPTCCSRYANIQDSLYANSNMTAKRQWSVLAGAAGLETNLSAIQYTPSTGAILWASATPSLPAYQAPAITLNADELFSYSVSISDDFIPNPAPELLIYPNPLPRYSNLYLKSSFMFCDLDVFNVRGQNVHSVRYRGMNKERVLNLPELPNGIYMLRVKAGDSVSAYKKLVVIN